MSSTRAAGVAEVLWELKRADKVATYSAVAERAGFSAGSTGRTVITALKVVRRDWPHLQWWRAVKDDGVLEKGSEHHERLIESGFEIEPADGHGDAVVLKGFEQLQMHWSDEPAAEAADEA